MMVWSLGLEQFAQNRDLDLSLTLLRFPGINYHTGMDITQLLFLGHRTELGVG